MSKAPANGKVNEEINKKISNNKIFVILNKKVRNNETLKELLDVLNEPANLVDLNIRDPAIEGSFLHFLTLTAGPTEQISWRMVYALSNAGLDVNISNSKDGTALHMAFKRGYTEVGFNFIEALLKVGIDTTLKNKHNKVAFDYMEQNEQFLCIYNAHTPSIWKSVEESNMEDIYRLTNAWIKVDCKKDNIDLISFANQKSDLVSEGLHPYKKYAQSVVNVLETVQNANYFVHALFAFDLPKMEMLLKQKNFHLNPNMADYCYCYTWYNPVYRNLPRFILEIALDSGEDAIIKLMLKNSANVNFLHSQLGYPFFFLAFEKKYRHLKTEILKNADLKTKNYRGETILFHLCTKYIETMLKKTTEKFVDKEYPQFLLNEFAQLLEEEPTLIAARNFDDITVIEKILSSDREVRRVGTEILFKISLFLQKLTESENIEPFRSMILQGYGPILVNTPIFLDIESTVRERVVDVHRRVAYGKWLENSSYETIKSLASRLLRQDFVNMVNTFFKAIKIGDMNNLMQIIQMDYDNNLMKVNDFSGRTCLHLSILYGRSKITKFFVEKNAVLLNKVDYLNRTPLHYACATNEAKQIEVLTSNKTDETIRDCKFLLAEEYQLKDVYNDAWFGVKNFRQTESKRVNGSHSFVRCFYSSQIRKAVDEDDVGKLVKLNSQMKEYGFSFKDLPHYREENIYVDGKAYEPPLEQALAKKSPQAFKYILENTLTDEGKREIKTARIRSAYGIQGPDGSNRLKTATLKAANKALDIVKLREIAFKSELDEFVDIIDNLEKDKEIPRITMPNVNSHGAATPDFTPQSYKESLNTDEKSTERMDDNKSQEGQESKSIEDSDPEAKSSTCNIL